jgi:integrase
LPRRSKTKGGEPRVFVLPAPLKKLLKAQRKVADALEATDQPCPLVFHRNGKQIEYFYDAWKNACDSAEVPGRLIHDLRRTAIRNLVRAGVSEGVAMKMCGHKTRAVFDRYNVTSEKDLQTAAALLSAHHKVLARASRTNKNGL